MSYDRRDKNGESFIKKQSNLNEAPDDDDDENNGGDNGAKDSFGVQ
jgi:hypothetical protein